MDRFDDRPGARRDDRDDALRATNGELVLTNDREELRGELEAIADRVEDWKTTYDVQSPEELEATLADERPADEIRERRTPARISERCRGVDSLRVHGG